MRSQNISDYTENQLPKNRIELFFDILKNQWQVIILLSFSLVLFLLPLIIHRYVNLLQISRIIEQNNDTSILFSQLLGQQVIYLIIRIPLLLLLSVFIAGSGRILKRLSFLQGIFFFADFARGVKENIRDQVLGTLLYALSSFVIEFLAIYLQLKGQMIGYYLLRIAHLFLILPITLIFYCLSNIYRERFIKKVSIAIMVLFHFFPKTIAFLVIFYLPLLVLMIPISALQLLFPIGFFLFFGIVFMLSFVLWMNHCFDHLINRTQFPNLYRKGVHNNINS